MPLLDANSSIVKGLPNSLATYYLDLSGRARCVYLTSTETKTNKFTLASTGLVNNDMVKLREPVGVTSSLPTSTPQLTYNTPYYVGGVSGSDFYLTLTPGGAAIAMTTGSGGDFILEVIMDGYTNKPTTFDARHRGAAYGAGGKTYAVAIPTSSARATAGLWTVYEFEKAVYADIVSELDCSFVHLPETISTSAEVSVFMGNTTYKKVELDPTIIVGIRATRVVDSNFVNATGTMVKRFAVLSKTAAVSNIGIRANADFACTLVCKN